MQNTASFVPGNRVRHDWQPGQGTVKRVTEAGSVVVDWDGEQPIMIDGQVFEEFIAPVNLIHI